MDQLLIVRLADRHGADPVSVAEDGDGIAEAEYLFKPVRDVDHHDPVLAQLFQHAEENVHFVVRQRRGRLVEDQDAAVLQQRLRDLDQLTVGDREVLDLLRAVDLDAHVVEDLLAAADHLLGIHKAAGADLLADEQIFVHRHLRDQVQLLIDHADAGGLRFDRRESVDGFSVHHDLALGRGDRAGDHFAKRRFPRAVLAEERVDLAFLKINADMIQNGHVAVGLCQLSQRQYSFIVHNQHPSKQYLRQNAGGMPRRRGIPPSGQARPPVWGRRLFMLWFSCSSDY